MMEDAGLTSFENDKTEKSMPTTQPANLLQELNLGNELDNTQGQIVVLNLDRE
jgi:hypothetical protein